MFVDWNTTVMCFVCHRMEMDTAFGMVSATQTKKVKLRTAIMKRILQS